MGASEIIGRAYRYRLIFKQIPPEVRERMLKAQTESEILLAFEGASYKQEFEPLASLILQVSHEPDFPKRDHEAQANFLAESLAARGALTPRSSRDICARARARERAKSPYKIIRHEYYVECECGYKGPARDNACHKCGAQIPLSLGITPGFGPG